MIDNRELRIGNFIQYNDGDICRVIGISEFGLDVKFKEETTYIEHKPNFHIVKMKVRFVFRGLGMSVTYVDTLHHLQNLVYAVSGEELEVSL